jgi:hypothetical protein
MFGTTAYSTEQLYLPVCASTNIHAKTSLLRLQVDEILLALAYVSN